MAGPRVLPGLFTGETGEFSSTLSGGLASATHKMKWLPGAAACKRSKPAGNARVNAAISSLYTGHSLVEPVPLCPYNARALNEEEPRAANG